MLAHLDWIYFMFSSEVSTRGLLLTASEATSRNFEEIRFCLGGTHGCRISQAEGRRIKFR